MAKLYAAVTNTSNIIDVRYTRSYNDSAAILTVRCLNSTVDIGDYISCELGYEGNHPVIFRGYVKTIDKAAQPYVTTITAYSEMIRAVDYFIASTDPNSPYTARNIAAEDLVKDIMAMAGLNNFGYDATSFIFAPDYDLEVNLATAYDYCNTISNTLAWDLHDDNNGKVWFVDRRPYVVSGDTPVYSFTDADIINFQYSILERDLRNRIVVYGGNNIYAEAKSATSYDPLTGTSRQILPPGFYKTTVASAWWIGSQTMANKAASYNLDKLNRLTVEATLNVVGTPNIDARDIINVNSSTFGINDNFFVYAVDQNWGKSGYTTTLTLRM